MTKSAPQVFKDITTEQWAKLTAKAKAAGIDLNGTLAPPQSLAWT
jgi:hypothetical protein